MSSLQASYVKAPLSMSFQQGHVCWRGIYGQRDVELWNAMELLPVVSRQMRKAGEKNIAVLGKMIIFADEIKQTLS